MVVVAGGIKGGGIVVTGPELRASLAALDLGQRDFARLLGVHHMAVNHWIHGRNPVPSYVEAVLDLIERNFELRGRLVAAGLEDV